MKNIQNLIRSIVGNAVLVVALPFVLVVMAQSAFAQTADVRYAGVFYQDEPTSVNAMYCDYSGNLPWVSSTGTGNRSFVTSPSPTSSKNTTDPWVSSALIEYDQPYPNTGLNDNKYPNHCLALCMNVKCSNKPLGGSTYSISFPLQQIKFDIVKYYNGKNVANAEETPAVRSIDLYPNEDDARCGSYHCPGGANSGYTCNSATSYCSVEDTSSSTPACATDSCYSFSDGVAPTCSCNSSTKVCNFAVFNHDGTESRDGVGIPFCAAWDGSYEIAGEFGKTNGQFAFRATVKTDAPGDNMIVDKIAFDSTIAYPGMNQIPMQVDVTNIHTVRSTPSVVGNITKVSAQPYTFAYRLSKDSDVRVVVLDASTDDALMYSTTTTPNIESTDIVRTLVDWQPRLGEGMKGKDGETQITEFDSWDGRDDNGLLLPAGNYIVALQAKTEDEWPGIDFSRAVTRQMSLDPLKLTDVVSTGLTKQSTAYASIAYTPTESAKVYWNIYTPGTTFANVLTNSAAPTGTGPTPTAGTGRLVYSSAEDRVGRMNFTSKWDGTCQSSSHQWLCGNISDGCDGTTFPAGAYDENGGSLKGVACITSTSGCFPSTYYNLDCERTYAQGEKLSTGETCSNSTCTETFQPGAPMPDGNYVYALWAEIPYNGCYSNKANGVSPSFNVGSTCTITANTKQFTGVKTLKYNIGEVSVERGVVDITIQPVSYSTVGSSPTAYGLDPFIFKYSLARDATAIAKVTNTAGVDVKYLTPKEGITQVAQQMNTLSWDGRDDAGRMVTPGTYMFVVETKDAMFPAVTNRASAVFPVDMYRVVDVATTDVYGDSDAKATISYSLSKPMNVQVNIYNKDVVIPNYQTSTGDYNADATVTSTATWTTPYYYVSSWGDAVPSLTLTDSNTTSATTANNHTEYGTTPSAHRDIFTVSANPDWDGATTTCVPATPSTCAYRVSVLREYLNTSTVSTKAWPPRVCDTVTDSAYFTNNYIDPAKKPQCIYVNDTTFTNYPTDAELAAGVVDVRLQPIKTFERSSLQPGDGLQITEEWDALYFYNPEKCSAGSTNLTNCTYEMVPDGQYPFYVSARSNEAFDRYYADRNDTTYVQGAPFTTSTDVKQESYWYATDKVTSKINITRGAVYFLDGSTVVYPNAPQLFNVSSGPVFVPPYEINFSVSRAATVEIAIVALQPNVCNPDPAVQGDLKNNRAGDVCKYLSTMTIANVGTFDPNIVRKTYWDGTDNNGFYVKPGLYEVRLTAKNYPNPDMYQPTVKQITLNADLLKVFDLLEADGYSISQRGTSMKIGYQVSVPMKVAIQIFKPGTTIYDYQKGTLRNPTTGTEVQDIHEVLVKSIVGIRPATTLIEEVWDGTDYAGQEVPDGTYPFRFVTALHSADVDSTTGEIVGEWAQTDGQSTNSELWKINRVADTYEYQNLHKATVAIGDGQFVCADWEKTVFFYPNPFNTTNGTLEITKMPVPGEVSIKFFNLAGDLVRESNYTCVDANNYQVTMGNSLKFQPDNSVSNVIANLNDMENIRNAALRCRWDKTNQHGKKVARGVYFGLIDFKAQMGREHCQKVVKVLIP